MKTKKIYIEVDKVPQHVCDQTAKDYNEGKLTLSELLLKTTKPKQND